ncbi:invasion associated locus B family protein [Roseovarius sp. M141]|uniref:invasion associated locus B family protein n=1 Tax=Roseovarius sp. M141 TaxID=2583806 RepID=UPI0020CEBD66|nr:invasion associated locus B family protein [Roseovarius sp. M141]MCQ0093212.1 invasion associated locus B family protein [Roseovarius sp. M141]
MQNSLSILSLAAALGLAGAAFAQDTATGDAAAAEGAAAATEETAPDTGAADAAGTDATGTDAAAAPADAPTDTPADAPATEGEAFATGTEVAEKEPPVYIKEKFGDWSLRCFRNADGDDPCQLYQLLREEGGNPVAEFSIFRISGQAPAVAGATAIVPLITLLTEELKISVDGGTAKSYPYRVCTEAGCVAQIGMTEQDIAVFKKGAKAQMVLVPAQAPDQKVKINISLNGFTAGYDAVGTFTE